MGASVDVVCSSTTTNKWCDLIMPRHSKNNTASAVFTKAEYGMLRDVWGTKSRRLGAESMRHFDQCSLCLGTVQSPVACSRGHLFCRECILSSLLEQKQDLAALKASLDKMAAEHEEQRLQARRDAIARVEQDFERAQGAGISSARSMTDRSRDRARRRSRSPVRARDRSRSPDRNGTYTSRLVDLPARIALQTERAIADTMRRLDEEQMLAKQHKIPAYWLPSLTPSADADPADVVKRTEELLASRGLDTRCYVADKLGHPTTIKSLIEVKFVKDSRVESGDAKVDGDEAEVHEDRKICPSCRKTLSDVTQTYVLRRCGHVHCTACVDSLIMPALKRAEKLTGFDGKSETSKEDRPRCLECGTAVKSSSKDLIALQREGTGFASGGLSETKLKGISFQG